jgi:hypothetical protein
MRKGPSTAAAAVEAERGVRDDLLAILEAVDSHVNQRAVSQSRHDKLVEEVSQD